MKLIIEGIEFSLSDTGLQSALLAAYAKKLRPRCLCVSGGVEMYLARISGSIVVKRMPGTGEDHHNECDSYEPPPEVSGRGALQGVSIRDDPESEQAVLRLAFSLSKSGSRTAPVPTGTVSDTVKSDGNKLTLLSLLHYLWDEGQLNRWSPGMARKRNWYVVRKCLLSAAQQASAKGQILADAMFIPESFQVEQKEAILARRRQLLAPLSAVQGKGQRLMIVVGEIKEIGVARFGKKLVLKHLPDYPFMLADDLHKRLEKRFVQELGLWNAFENSHMIMIGTFLVAQSGFAIVQELSLMLCTENWIPFESAAQKQLLDALVGRRYARSLRYNIPASSPLAVAVLTDTDPITALYLTPTDADDGFVEMLTAIITESKLTAWHWDLSTDLLPTLPAPGRQPIDSEKV